MGASYSGSHVVAVAAQDEQIAAVVSLIPAADGLATLRLIAQQDGLARVARLVAHGMADLAAGVRGDPPRMIPVVGPPGGTAMITAPGASEAYTSLAGPTWRNVTGARHALEVAGNRATTHAHRLRCPALFQIATDDQVVPVGAARRMAARAGGPSHVEEYPVDHFDVYDGAWQRRVVADQIAFLGQALS